MADDTTHDFGIDLSDGYPWDLWCKVVDIEDILELISMPEIKLPESVLCLNVTPGVSCLRNAYTEGGCLEFIMKGLEPKRKRVTFGDCVLALQRWAAAHWRDIPTTGTKRIVTDELSIVDIRNILYYIVD